MAEKKKTTETKKISKGNEILQAINKIQVDMNSRFDEVNARLDEQHLLINALINRTDIHSAKIDSLTVEMAKLSGSVKATVNDMSKSIEDVKSKLGLIVDVVTDIADDNLLNIARLKTIK